MVLTKKTKFDHLFTIQESVLESKLLWDLNFKENVQERPKGCRTLQERSLRDSSQ